jgi:hypothetical protein
MIKTIAILFMDGDCFYHYRFLYERLIGLPGLTAGFVTTLPPVGSVLLTILAATPDFDALLFIRPTALLPTRLKPSSRLLVAVASSNPVLAESSLTMPLERNMFWSILPELICWNISSKLNEVESRPEVG